MNRNFTITYQKYKYELCFLLLLLLLLFIAIVNNKSYVNSHLNQQTNTYVL